MDHVEEVRRAIASVRPEPADLAHRPTLDRVMHDLGRALLSTLTACPDPAAPVGGVAIHDPAEDGIVPPRAIVLGVGVDARNLDAAVAAAVERDALALVVRLPLDLDTETLARVERTGLTLLGAAPGVTWHQLTTLLATALATPPDDALLPDAPGGFAGGDLFGLASAICLLIDAPVTIEDRNANVLAFSERQDETDHIRIETILDRRVPRIYGREDEASGASRAIMQSAEPVYLPPIDLGDGREALPRVAVAIRAGDEFLGMVWAVVHGPLGAERDKLLLDASRLVALHLLHQRAGADVARRVRHDLVATALESGPGAAAALARLGLDDTPVAVVAMGTRAAPDVAVREDPAWLARSSAEEQRTASAFALHLATTHPGAAVATVNGLTYGLVPVRHADGGDGHVEATCRRFLLYQAGPATRYAAVGRVVRGADEIAVSRLDAERTARVLRDEACRRTTATSVDVAIDSLLLELRSLAAASRRGPTGAYARLLEHDRTRNTAMVDTLRAWLDSHGDVTVAAAANHVHPNTFRYRLRRMSEIGEFELTDPQARFALDLQLRIFPPG